MVDIVIYVVFLNKLKFIKKLLNRIKKVNFLDISSCKLNTKKYHYKKKPKVEKLAKLVIYNPLRKVYYYIVEGAYIKINNFRFPDKKKVRKFPPFKSFKMLMSFLSVFNNKSLFISNLVKIFELPYRLKISNSKSIGKRKFKISNLMVEFNKSIKFLYLRFYSNDASKFGVSAINYKYDRKVNNFKRYLRVKRLDSERDLTTNFFKEDFLATTKKNYKKNKNMLI